MTIVLLVGFVVAWLSIDQWPAWQERRLWRSHQRIAPSGHWLPEHLAAASSHVLMWRGMYVGRFEKGTPLIGVAVDLEGLQPGDIIQQLIDLQLPVPDFTRAYRTQMEETRQAVYIHQAVRNFFILNPGTYLENKILWVPIKKLPLNHEAFAHELDHAIDTTLALIEAWGHGTILQRLFRNATQEPPLTQRRLCLQQMSKVDKDADETRRAAQYALSHHDGPLLELAITILPEEGLQTIYQHLEAGTLPPDIHKVALRHIVAHEPDSEVVFATLTNALRTLPPTYELHNYLFHRMLMSFPWPRCQTELLAYAQETDVPKAKSLLAAIHKLMPNQEESFFAQLIQAKGMMYEYTLHTWIALYAQEESWLELLEKLPAQREMTYAQKEMFAQTLLQVKSRYQQKQHGGMSLVDETEAPEGGLSLAADDQGKVSMAATAQQNTTIH